MFKVFLKNTFALFFAIIGLVVIFLIMGPILDTKKYDEIVANGIETTAEVVDVNSSTITYLDVKYYSVKYVFKDGSGVKHDGDSTHTFTYSDLLLLELDNTILIKYDPETFESIEADYSSKNNPSLIGSTIALVLVGITDLVLWVVAIRIIANAFIKIWVLKNGEETTAEVVNIHSNVRVSNRHLYYIKYKWTDSLGNVRISKTGADYSEEIARELLSRQNIIIKAKGKHSAIVVDREIKESAKNITTPYMAQHSFEENIFINKTSEEIRRCNHCNQVVERKSNFCPNCGAEMNEEENN